MKTTIAMLVALGLFSLSSMAQISGNYNTDQSGLGCFGEYIGERFNTTMALEIGAFNGDTASRKLTLELRGVSYPINCTVVYDGKITGTPDGRFLGGLSRSSCRCNVPGGDRQCQRRIDPFILEPNNQPISVVSSGGQISIEQLREPPSPSWPCGDGYPQLKFNRR